MIGRMEQKQLLTTRTTTLAFPVPAPVPPSASVQNAVSTEAQQQLSRRQRPDGGAIGRNEEGDN